MDHNDGKVDATELYEEYTAPPRLGPDGKPIPKSRGLQAAGYSFPPAGGPEPPLTKANLAKGIGVAPARPAPPPATNEAGSEWPVPSLPGMAPSEPVRPNPATNSTQAYPVPDSLVRQLEAAPRANPARPASVKVAEGDLFEEYRRPGLDQHPKTGKGIRAEPPPPPSAKEILATYEPPEPEVLRPKRFGIMPTGTQGGNPAQHGSPPSAGPLEPEAARAEAHAPVRVQPPASHPTEGDEAEAAKADAVADVAATETAGLVMSHSAANGPIRTVIHHDEGGRAEAHGQVESIPVGADGPSVPVFASVPGTTPYVHPSRKVDVEAPMPANPPRSRLASTPHRDDLEVEPGGELPRIAFVQCLFNRPLTDAMLAHARDEAERLGAPIAGALQVPGVYDAPLAVKRLLLRPDVDAVVVLGVVIQGETGHDEVITHATAQTLQAIAVNADKPVGLGITGPRMTEGQAWARVESGAFAVKSVVVQYRALLQA